MSLLASGSGALLASGSLPDAGDRPTPRSTLTVDRCAGADRRMAFADILAETGSAAAARRVTSTSGEGTDHAPVRRARAQPTRPGSPADLGSAEARFSAGKSAPAAGILAPAETTGHAEDVVTRHSSPRAGQVGPLGSAQGARAPQGTRSAQGARSAHAGTVQTSTSTPGFFAQGATTGPSFSDSHGQDASGAAPGRSTRASDGEAGSNRVRVRSSVRNLAGDAARPTTPETSRPEGRRPRAASRAEPVTAVWRRATVPGATVGARGGSTEGGSASGAARLASSARLLAPVAGRQASEARGATSQPTGATAEAGSRVSEPPPSFGSAWTPADGLPSGTAAQARQLDMPGVAAQLVRVISVPRVTAEGTYTVQVVLHPVELGEVSARITARESGLSVHLVAASDLGTEALQRALPELRTALSAFGTKTTVTLGTRRAHGTGRSSSWPTGDGTGAGTRGGGAQPRRGSGLGPEPTPRAGMLGPVDPLGPPPPRSERPRGRTGNVLDVRV